ncbi:ATP-binding protein [Luteimonas pelagia]
MNQATSEATTPTRWSNDLLRALSLLDHPVVLLDDTHRAAHANDAARALAERAGGIGVDGLCALVPPEAWATAAREGKWTGGSHDADGGPLLEIELYPAAHAGLPHDLLLLHDVSARAGRERELRRRNQELEDAYRHLASTQEQLLQSEKMASIGQLAAGIAHEINNPIGYVHSNLGTLRDYAAALAALIDAYATELQADGAERPALDQLRGRLDIDFILGDLPNLLDESREGIERVTRIVQDLKEFSHVGRDERPRRVDLHRGLDSTINIVWNDLKYKVRLEKHYGTLPPVECHPSEINQVFMNLLINAGQAIDDRGTITITTGVDGACAWVAIADSGCGMPEDVVQRIFEPFYTTKPVGRGTGLGLAISYRIVAKHGGRIEVQSRPGAGSTFRVLLPVAQGAD